ncbi:LD-carboxypeptidase [Clostridium tertium]|uniref:Putative murein peptide carboxypeptidase n=1 Tax=Clostridium tertium TaxID=1559 RepID=A0A6N3CK09_9CLOT
MSKNKLKPITNKSTIGIIAPASPESPEFIDEKIDLFSKLGFKIKKGKYLYDNTGYLAGDDRNRATDLNFMFADTDVDAIVSFRGGYGSIRIMPYLDLKTIKKNPKMFFGYSDITLLLNYISSKCNFPTFHGPMINSDFTDIYTREYFLKVLLSNKNKLTYDLNDVCAYDYIIKNNKDFSGKIVGGNLSIICSSIGTPYEIKLENNIILIEDVNESPYVVDRMLSQLLSCGKLQKSSAIIVGDFTNCVGSKSSPSINEVINERLSILKQPIIYGFKLGHDYPNISIPIGSVFKYLSKDKILIEK